MKKIIICLLLCFGVLSFIFINSKSVNADEIDDSSSFDYEYGMSEIPSVPYLFDYEFTDKNFEFSDNNLNFGSNDFILNYRCEGTDGSIRLELFYDYNFPLTNIDSYCNFGYFIDFVFVSTNLGYKVDYRLRYIEIEYYFDCFDDYYENVNSYFFDSLSDSSCALSTFLNNVYITFDIYSLPDVEDDYYWACDFSIVEEYSRDFLYSDTLGSSCLDNSFGEFEFSFYNQHCFEKGLESVFGSPQYYESELLKKEFKKIWTYYDEIQKDVVSLDEFYNSYNIEKHYFLDIAYDKLYDLGFSHGEDASFDIGYNNGFDEGYELGVSDGYQNGLDVGYDSGLQEGENVNANFGEMILSVINAPIDLISNVLNFDFLGVNLSGLVFFLISSAIVIAIIKFFV